MIETKEFSYDIIYDNAQDFFKKWGITKKSFRLKWHHFVTEITMHEHLTEDEASVFIADSFDDVGKDLTVYLNNNYFFEPKLIHLIEAYDNFFNHELPRPEGRSFLGV